ncbi:hypothetical protein [Buttiauxella sp. 3AFRM03]|uniref:hypothetical protein n=1 Tax=Buttiauxella sp. 3AFRM03 TaxID=2479367 RepID=UPI001EE3D90E|nr:hypothetical protein [Buttiauxella sp. 3AFRM03]
MDNVPDIKLPVWMNKGEPLTLAHASQIWWDQVWKWLRFPLAQINADTCDESLLTLLGYQRDITRFPGEPLDLFRLRVKYAFQNAKDAASIAGFERIFRRLGVGHIEQHERVQGLDWDIIIIRLQDGQISGRRDLLNEIISKYGRTCRRYQFEVVSPIRVSVSTGAYGGDYVTHVATMNGVNQ